MDPYTTAVEGSETTSSEDSSEASNASPQSNYLGAPSHGGNSESSSSCDDNPTTDPPNEPASEPKYESTSSNSNQLQSRLDSEDQKGNFELPHDSDDEKQKAQIADFSRAQLLLSDQKRGRPGANVLSHETPPPLTEEEQAELAREEMSAKLRWNEEFQTILAMDEDLAKWQALSCCYRDFVYAAKTYGRIIISEMFATQKEIKPITVGGRAGGLKYLTTGILFKFAVDTVAEVVGDTEIYMYGLHNLPAHDLAAKAAGHELKGLISLFNCRHVAPLLHFPLLALIDYRGFRLLAISYLPVNSSTLKYGSANGGETVHADVPELVEQMELIGKALNLQPHHVGEKMIALCGDIEGHLGTDNRFYCLDFARVFPPQLYTNKEIEMLITTFPSPPPLTNEKLYKLLRPELVRTNDTPLNSDACSLFLNGNYPEEATIAKRNVQKATIYLIKKRIPEFCEHLKENYSPVQLKKKNYSLTDEAHRFGINCRHFGRIRSKILETDDKAQFKPAFVLVEIIARTCKNHLQEQWRMSMEEKRVASSEPYLNVAVDYLNVLLRDEDYWTNPFLLKSRIQIGFNKALSVEELSPSYDLRFSFVLQQDLFGLFFKRLQRLSRVKLTERMNQLIAQSKGHTRIQLLRVDIINISTNVKQLDLIELCEGKMLFKQAQEAKLARNNREQGERCFSLANERFRSAYSANTSSAEILFWWGRSKAIDSERFDHTNLKKKKEKLENAEKKLLDCCRLQPNQELFRQAHLMRAGIFVNWTTCDYNANRLHKLDSALKCIEELKTMQFYDANSKPSTLESEFVKEVKNSYNALLPVVLKDFVADGMELHSRWNPGEMGALKAAKESFLHFIKSNFIAMYLWQGLSLKVAPCVSTTLQASDVLMRWAIAVTLLGHPSTNYLFGRAGQLCEMAIRSFVRGQNGISFEIKSNEDSLSQPQASHEITIYSTEPDKTGQSKQNEAELQTCAYVLQKNLEWRKRWIVLQGITISQYTDQYYGMPVASQALDGCKFYSFNGDYLKRKFCLRVTGFKEIYDISFFNQTEKDQWIVAIQKLTPNPLLVGEGAAPLTIRRASALQVLDSIPAHIGGEYGLRPPTQANYVFQTKLQDGYSPSSPIPCTQTHRLVPVVHGGHVREGHMLTDNLQALFDPSDLQPTDQKFEFWRQGKAFDVQLTLDLVWIHQIDFLLDVAELNADLDITAEVTLISYRADDISLLKFGSPFTTDDLMKMFDQNDPRRHSTILKKLQLTLNRVVIHQFTLKNHPKQSFMFSSVRGPCHRYFVLRYNPNGALHLSKIKFWGSILGIPNLKDIKSSGESSFTIWKSFSHTNESATARTQEPQSKSKSQSTIRPASPSVPNPRNSATPQPRRVTAKATMGGAKAEKLNGTPTLSSHLFLQNMFLGYEWIAAVLRMVEFTPLIKELVSSAARRLVKIQEADKQLHTPFSLKQLLESLPLQEAIKSHLSQTSQNHQINLTKLFLKNSKIVNSFVIKEYTSWSKCTEIDLSETLITDTEILQYVDFDWFGAEFGSLATSCGGSLEKLVLKGCTRLTTMSIHHISYFLPGLKYLGVWDAPEETLVLLATATKISALDLSYCTNVSHRVLGPLTGLSYISLSCIRGTFERKSLIAMAKNNTSLQALDLSRPPPTPQEDPITLLYDDQTIARVLKALPELTFLDLTYCQKSFKAGRGLTSQALASLSGLKHLQSLNITDVPIEALDLARVMSTLPYIRDLVSSRINFPHGNTGKSPRSPVVASFLGELCNRTFNRLVLQNIPTINDGFANVLKVSHTSLTELDISQGVQLTDTTAIAISTCYKLVSLSIEGCPFSENGLQKIITNCINLIAVNFGGTNITDANLKTLLVHVASTHPTKKSLHTLQLSGCINRSFLSSVDLTKQSLRYIQSQKDLRVLKLTLACSTLHYLDVSSCQNMPKNEEAIQQLLQDLVKILPTAYIRIQLHGKK